MKIPQIFVPERDLTKKINNYLEERVAAYNNQQQTLLYDHIKSVYAGFEPCNIVLLYGPPGTGKTFTSNKTKEALSKEYAISYINLQPIDAYTIVTKSEYFERLENKIIPALSANKKVYIDIMGIEKFGELAQGALDSILIKYKGNRNIVFIFQSYYKYLKGQTIDIEFTKKQL